MTWERVGMIVLALLVVEGVVGVVVIIAALVTVLLRVA
jgi:hypothetical protein